MPSIFDQQSPRDALVQISKEFHHHGWMAGTAGNLSIRARGRADSFWITASGLPKGQLDEHDFLLIQIDNGDVLEQFNVDDKPSAETSIHQVLYQIFPDVQACFHVHSVDASLATRNLVKDAVGLLLPPLEMLKGLGIWETNPVIELPIFENLPQISAVSQNIAKQFANHPPKVPGLLIRDHGITVWGKSAQETYNRLEVIEFLLV